MCIGEPLRVVSCDGTLAWCEAGDTREHLDMMLVGAQPAGTWVMAFQGAARQVLSELEARRSLAARAALGAVLRGEDRLDDFFADLVGRSPELPPHLRSTS